MPGCRGVEGGVTHYMSVGQEKFPASRSGFQTMFCHKKNVRSDTEVDFYHTWNRSICTVISVVVLVGMLSRGEKTCWGRKRGHLAIVFLSAFWKIWPKFCTNCWYFAKLQWKTFIYLFIFFQFMGHITLAGQQANALKKQVFWQKLMNIYQRRSHTAGLLAGSSSQQAGLVSEPCFVKKHAKSDTGNGIQHVIGVKNSSHGWSCCITDGCSPETSAQSCWFLAFQRYNEN